LEVLEVIEVVDKNGRGREGPIRRYMDLLIYKLAYKLALEVSKLTKTFPREERFELGRQLRRSARSIVANIVEGWAKRHSPAEFKRHLLIATGECAETGLWLQFSADENAAKKEACLALQADYSKLGLMIYRLWKTWKKFDSTDSPESAGFSATSRTSKTSITSRAYERTH
jgi:four helix bundle protein